MDIKVSEFLFESLQLKGEVLEVIWKVEDSVDSARIVDSIELRLIINCLNSQIRIQINGFNVNFSEYQQGAIL